uniref:Uncharacterized protein n=1 Tax=Ditylenchus dipsaci TaxID=166011 RepID=A0A915DLH1_9BILA
MMGLFGKTKVDPKEQVRELQRKMRREMQALKRQINGIEREEEKVKRQIKESAKKGDREVCIVLAKGIIQSRKAVTRLHTWIHHFATGIPVEIYWISRTMDQEAKSVLEKLNALSKEEVRKKLRVQLVSSIGTFGSIHGCSLDEAVAEFKEDWDEELQDYALALGYSSVLLMIRDMDAVRLEFSGRDFRVCAVAAPEILHCFNLIDRTKPRIHDRHRNRKCEEKPVIIPSLSESYFHQPSRSSQMSVPSDSSETKKGFGMKGHSSFVQSAHEATSSMCSSSAPMSAQQQISEFSKSAPTWSHEISRHCQTMDQEAKSVLEKLIALSKEEVRKKLRVQLVSSIGTFGSIHGCSLDEAVAEFKEDWDEELQDYALALSYSSVLLMIRDMDAVRLEFSGRDFRVCAVAAPEILHCFNLIDRTKPRILDHHRNRKCEEKPVIVPSRSESCFHQPSESSQMSAPSHSHSTTSSMCSSPTPMSTQQKISEFSKSAPAWRLSESSSSAIASSGLSEIHPALLREHCSSSVKHFRFGNFVSGNQNWSRLLSGWH